MAFYKIIEIVCHI